LIIAQGGALGQEPRRPFYVVYSDMTSPGPTVQLNGSASMALPRPQLRLLYTPLGGELVRVDATFRALSPGGSINVTRARSFTARLTPWGVSVEGRPSIFLLSPSVLRNASQLSSLLKSGLNVSLLSLYGATLSPPGGGGSYSSMALEASSGVGGRSATLLAFFDRSLGLLLELVGTLSGDPLLAQLGISSYSGLLYLSDRSSDLGLSAARPPTAVYVAEVALFLGAAGLGGVLLWKLARAARASTRRQWAPGSRGSGLEYVRQKLIRIAL
ncbi:MAG: hypothetical protein C4310_14505, partial [Chloroflexota bacterium]